MKTPFQQAMIQSYRALIDEFVNPPLEIDTGILTFVKRKTIANPFWHSDTKPLADHLFNLSIAGIEPFVEEDTPETVEMHYLEEMVSWQETLYVNQLKRFIERPINDLLATLNEDTPKILVWNDLKIIYDGNHRIWTLAFRDVRRISLPTIVVTDEMIARFCNLTGDHREQTGT